MSILYDVCQLKVFCYNFCFAEFVVMGRVIGCLGGGPSAVVAVLQSALRRSPLSFTSMECWTQDCIVLDYVFQGSRPGSGMLFNIQHYRFIN